MDSGWWRGLAAVVTGLSCWVACACGVAFAEQAPLDRRPIPRPPNMPILPGTGTLMDRMEQRHGTPTKPPDANGDSFFDVMNDRFKRQKFIETEDGAGTVRALQAKFCDICKKPLYLHADDRYECVPVDEEGNPRQMPKIHTKPANCPCCGARFAGAIPGGVNAKGGSDADFCQHSVGKWVVHSNVWMCADCGYAGQIELFETGLRGKFDEESRAWVRENLTPKIDAQMRIVVGLKPGPACRSASARSRSWSRSPRSPIT